MCVSPVARSSADADDPATTWTAGTEKPCGCAGQQLVAKTTRHRWLASGANERSALRQPFPLFASVAERVCDQRLCENLRSRHAPAERSPSGYVVRLHAERRVCLPPVGRHACLHSVRTFDHLRSTDRGTARYRKNPCVKESLPDASPSSNREPVSCCVETVRISSYLWKDVDNGGRN